MLNQQMKIKHQRRRSPASNRAAGARHAGLQVNTSPPALLPGFRAATSQHRLLFNASSFSKMHNWSMDKQTFYPKTHCGWRDWAH